MAPTIETDLLASIDDIRSLTGATAIAGLEASYMDLDHVDAPVTAR